MIYLTDQYGPKFYLDVDSYHRRSSGICNLHKQNFIPLKFIFLFNNKAFIHVRCSRVSSLFFPQY